MPQLDIMNTIVEILLNLGEEMERPELSSINAESRLYGESLDSLGIVMLATELEERIYDQTDCSITIVDERAMSQKNSPFLSVKTLARYVEQLLADEGAELR